MKSLKSLFLNTLVVSGLLTGMTASAGVDTSGGGNSVVCFNTVEMREKVYRTLSEADRAGVNAVNPFADPAVVAGIQSIESLDLFMHKLPRGRNQDQFLSLFRVDTLKDSDEVVRYLLGRLRAKNDFSEILSDRLFGLTWIAADGVARIPDTGLPLLLSPSCLIAQTAYRKGSQIFFDRHLYSKMDPVSQAVLVLHEGLYSIAKEQGATDALKVYEVVSLLIRSDEDLNKWGNDYLAQKLLSLLYQDQRATLTIPCQTRFSNSDLLPARTRVGQWGRENTYLERNFTVNLFGHAIQLQGGTEWIGCHELMTMVDLIGSTTSSGQAYPAAFVQIGHDLGTTISLGNLWVRDNPENEDHWGGLFNGVQGNLSADAEFFADNEYSRVPRIRIKKGNMIRLGEGIIFSKWAMVTWAKKSGGPTKEIELYDVRFTNGGRTLSSGTLVNDLHLGLFKRIKKETRIEFDHEGNIREAKQ